MSSRKSISDIVDFNPKRPIKKGEIKPFIEMASLPENERDIRFLYKKEFKGGGSKFKNGDTLFARITPCLENGKTAKVSCLEQGQFGHGSTELIVMTAKEPEVDEDYIYYLARHPEFRAYAQSRMEGTSGRQRVAWQALSEFKFKYPPKELRKEAGKQLKAFDDKIAINKQINQTLEQIAQAIFKSWFVDFEPVKAKINALTAGGSEEDALLAAMQAISGKDKAQLTQLQTENPEHYNQLRTTAELFPSAMQDSELGEIPESWRLDHIENLCEKVESGGTPKRSIPQYWGGNIKWLSSGEVRKSIVIETKETISIQGLQSSSAKVWPKLSTVIAMYGATAGQVCLLADDMATNQACCGLVPKQNHAALLYFSARNSIAELSGKASGSAQQNLNKGIVANHNVTIPSCEIATKFENSIIPIITTLIHNSLESSSLEQTRDALLPKLLSGELRFESKIYSDANYAMTSGHDEKVDSCS